MADEDGAAMDVLAVQVWAVLAAECGGEIPNEWTVARLQLELGRVATAMLRGELGDG